MARTTLPIRPVYNADLRRGLPHRRSFPVESVGTPGGNPSTAASTPQQATRKQPPQQQSQRDLLLLGGVSAANEKGGSCAQAHTHERTSEATDLFTAATSLSVEERQRLLDHLALSLQENLSPQHRELAAWSEAVRESVEAAVQINLPPALIRRAYAARSAWKPVEGIFAAARLEKVEVAVRSLVYRLFADILVEHAVYAAKKAEVPLSVKFLVNCSVNLPGLVENAFPGYLAAGLLPVVAKRLARRADMAA